MEWNEARRLLITADRMGDVSSRALSRGVAAGTHVRLRPGVHVSAAIWRHLTKEERLQVRMLALQTTSRSRPVFSHWAAALLHGLPVARRATERVDVAVEGERNRTLVAARVHRLALDGPEVVEIAGMLCTSLTRTVVDIGADAGFEHAVVIADAALALLGPDGRRLLDDAAEQAGRVRGAARLRLLLDFADPRSGSAGESISRVRIHRLGFAAPELQVEIVTDDRSEFGDFGWEEVLGLGEFDGEVKYRDDRTRRGGTVEDVVISEKNRENRMRRRRPRFCRWDWSDLHADRLERILDETGIPCRADRRRRPDPEHE